MPTVPTSRCFFFWPVLIFGKSTRKTGENTRKQAQTRENRRFFGANFWGGNWSVLIFTPFATMVESCLIASMTARLVIAKGYNKCYEYHAYYAYNIRTMQALLETESNGVLMKKNLYQE